MANQPIRHRLQATRFGFGTPVLVAQSRGWATWKDAGAEDLPFVMPFPTRFVRSAGTSLTGNIRHTPRSFRGIGILLVAEVEVVTRGPWDPGRVLASMDVHTTPTSWRTATLRDLEALYGMDAATRGSLTILEAAPSAIAA